VTQCITVAIIQITSSIINQLGDSQEKKGRQRFMPSVDKLHVDLPAYICV
jgi:hypothetical protein